MPKKIEISEDQMSFMPDVPEEVSAAAPIPISERDFSGKLVDSEAVHQMIVDRLTSTAEGTGSNAAVAELVDAKADFEKNSIPQPKRPKRQRPLSPRQRAYADVANGKVKHAPFPYGHAPDSDL